MLDEGLSIPTEVCWCERVSVSASAIVSVKCECFQQTGCERTHLPGGQQHRSPLELLQGRRTGSCTRQGLWGV